MDKFNANIHDVIGDHKKATIWGETVNESDLYYDAFFEKGKEIEGLYMSKMTRPWKI